ncbi:hypothetical protein BASA81_015394 [Batrachochytrium salamandrivorans]|nr:hypothetical protein BASA81_015394 [Batrachochytrium salamandrivorans]
MPTASLARFVLPLGYAGSMVGFTLMRKVNLQQYLKPHQVTIAVAAALTMLSFLMAELELISARPGDGKFDPLILCLQNFFLLAALFVRKEASAGEFASMFAGIGVLCLLASFSATECERYSNFTLGVLGLLLFGMAFTKFSSGDTKDRKLWLYLVWSAFALSTAFFCGPVLLVYAFAGLGSMYVVKLAHPALGDKFEPDYSTVAANDLS